MPSLNETGPEGRGPLTGRKRGRCRDDKNNQSEMSDNKTDDRNEIIYGFGRGRRLRGKGRGRGNSNRQQRMGRGFERK